MVKLKKRSKITISVGAGAIVAVLMFFFGAKSVPIPAGGIEIEFSGEIGDALIEEEAGTTLAALPEVEAVGATQKTENGNPDSGRGWWVETEAPQKFRDATIGTCVDTDGFFGSQCWDLGNLFWQNYAGRWLSTCGTGSAKGTWDCAKVNAGDDFILIENKHDLQAGDWVIFGTGRFGHIGMALGGVRNDHVALLGANQGGTPCLGSGSTVNIINIGLRDFVGAFRPKAYIPPEPEPAPVVDVEPEPDNLYRYTYKKGDTFGQVLIDLGLSDGSDLWGPGKKVEHYTNQLHEQGVWGNVLPLGTTIILDARK